MQWNTELVAFQQQPDHVDVTLKQPDGSTRKLDGSVGGRMRRREERGARHERHHVPGAPYEHTFFVADTEAIGPMKPGELNVYMWQDGFHLFFPMRGKDRWRVIGILPKALRARTDLKFEDLTADIRREAGAELSFKECSWFSTYRIHHRCAERFRDRRCFLLGDAAHVHSPAGGQGMNTGLQDAYNLGWKLALVVKGQADAALLDSYEQERQPVAQRLLRTTDRIFTLLVSDSWVAGVFRTRVLARILARAMTIERIRGARIPHDLADRYPLSEGPVVADARRAFRRAHRWRETASRGCISSCRRMVRSKTSTRSSTTRASTCWCSVSRRRLRRPWVSAIWFGCTRSPTIPSMQTS